MLKDVDSIPMSERLAYYREVTRRCGHNDQMLFPPLARMLAPFTSSSGGGGVARGIVVVVGIVWVELLAAAVAVVGMGDMLVVAITIAIVVGECPLEAYLINSTTAVGRM